MKKFALVLALLAIAGFVFADTVVVPELSGSAETKFGVNLQDVATGFETTTDASVSFTLIDEQSATAGGEDSLYGEITVSGFKLTGDNSELSVSAASASAKIVAGGISVTIGDDPSFEVNKAAALEKDNIDTKATASMDQGIAVSLTDLGLTLKIASQDGYLLDGGSDAVGNAVYFVNADGEVVKAGISDANTTALSAVDIEGDDMDMDDYVAAVTALETAGTNTAFFVASASAGSANTNNADHNYSISADYSLDLGDTGSVDVSVGYSMGSNSVGFSVGTPLSFGPASVTVGFDGMYDGGFSWDVGGSVGLDLGVAKIDLAGHYADDLDMTAKVDLSALADPLTLTVAADLFNMFVLINLDFDVAYDINGLKPYLSIGVDNMAFDAMELSVGASMSADFTGIDNTTVTLDYTSTNLDSDNGLLTAGVKISM